MAYYEIEGVVRLTAGFRFFHKENEYIAFEFEDEGPALSVYTVGMDHKSYQTRFFPTLMSKLVKLYAELEKKMKFNHIDINAGQIIIKKPTTSIPRDLYRDFEVCLCDFEDSRIEPSAGNLVYNQLPRREEGKRFVIDSNLKHLITDFASTNESMDFIQGGIKPDQQSPIMKLLREKIRFNDANPNRKQGLQHIQKVFPPAQVDAPALAPVADRPRWR